MSTLLDTNILTRLSQQTHPYHVAAQTAITTLRNQGETLNVVPQNLYEFWSVATRPVATNSGLGFTTAETIAEITRIRSLFHFLADTPAIYAEWERLVVLHDVKGKTAHDARLAAAMAVHGVTQILTFNDRDFTRYTSVTVLNPITLAAQSL